MTEQAAPSPGQILVGPLFNEPMRVETLQAHGAASWIVGVVGTNSERFRKVTMTAGDLESLTVLDPHHTFDGDGRLLRLGLQAYASGSPTSSIPTSVFRSPGSIRCPISLRRFTTTS